ncbi:hypothetical protein Lalb_Chr11g0075911 [Lupinus albus]|uniref:Uncharacterized protein n=1 Tax=Lupinus albus TaxID=3870 RepID=A0A6A4PTR8_LUPAL|nr:hypothetical protein Lalb_Chr11g0075911 [Lupinus albus]
MNLVMILSVLHDIFVKEFSLEGDANKRSIMLTSNLDEFYKA